MKVETRCNATGPRVTPALMRPDGEERMITKRYDSDFTHMRSDRFEFTLIAPNGDRVTYHELDGEQAEQLWRMWQTAAVSDSWELQWQSERLPGSVYLEPWHTGQRVFYVEDDGTVDRAKPGLVSRVDEPNDAVMVLWLDNDEVSEHHVSVLTPAN